jgi:nicotinamidase-related amidase
MKTALVVVDMQYDFLDVPEATLGVSGGEISLAYEPERLQVADQSAGTSILPIIYDLLQKDKWSWDIVAASQVCLRHLIDNIRDALNVKIGLASQKPRIFRLK